jgi:hypothetical protein
MLACVQRREFFSALPEHRFIHDGVSSVDRLRLVPGHSQRSAARDACALKISDRSASKVVHEPTGHACQAAGFDPGVTEIMDR